MLARAWVVHSRNKLAASRGILEQLKLCPDDVDEEEAAAEEIALFQGLALFYSGEADRSLEQSEKALALSPEGNVRSRSQAELHRALALQISGQADRAIWLLEDPVGNQDPVRRAT